MVIEVENLVKDFKTDFWKKKKRALCGVNFSVKEGSIYGFLGPNGAGKTTAIKVLMGLIFPTSGKARVLGRDIGEVAFKKEVGFLPESPYFYDYLKAEEFLGFYGALFGLSRKEIKKRTGELLAEVGLSGEKDVQLRKFSKGMLQRIGLAQAMINDPKLLILDEPMSGLDPIGRKHVRDIIIGLRDRGKTIFFSTHILSDVEMICDQVSIIVGGKVVDSGYIKDLVNPKVLLYEIEVGHDKRAKLGEKFLESAQFMERGKNLVLRAGDETELKRINSFLVEKGVNAVAVTPVKETLEDIFVKRVEQRNSDGN